MNHCTKEQLIAFETRVKALWEAGELPYLIHLCGGNEDQLIEIFKEIQPGDWVFSTHRNHYHALLSGMKPEVLLEKIKRGDSMFVFGRPSDMAGAVNFLSSSVLAGTCAIAAGVAHTIQQAQSEQIPGYATDGRGNPPAPVRSAHVWCFLGDGAEDEGHFYEAVVYATGQNLPVTFIIEDNNRSVDTAISERRGHVGDIWARKIPWPESHVRRYRYTPTYPHAGSGCKHHIIFKPSLASCPARPKLRVSFVVSVKTKPAVNQPVTMKTKLTVGQQIDIAANFEDAAGISRPLAGAPVWTSSDESIVKVVPSANNPLIATVISVGKGGATVRVTGEGDPTPGVDTIVGTVEVDVVDPEATQVVLTLGTAVPIPAAAPAPAPEPPLAAETPAPAATN